MYLRIASAVEQLLPHFEIQLKILKKFHTLLNKYNVLMLKKLIRYVCFEATNINSEISYCLLIAMHLYEFCIAVSRLKNPKQIAKTRIV